MFERGNIDIIKKKKDTFTHNMSFGENSNRFKSAFGRDGSQIDPKKECARKKEQMRQEILKKKQDDERLLKRKKDMEEREYYKKLRREQEIARKKREEEERQRIKKEKEEAQKKKEKAHAQAMELRKQRERNRQGM